MKLNHELFLLKDPDINKLMLDQQGIKFSNPIIAQFVYELICEHPYGFFITEAKEYSLSGTGKITEKTRPKLNANYAATNIATNLRITIDADGKLSAHDPYDYVIYFMLGNVLFDEAFVNSEGNTLEILRNYFNYKRYKQNVKRKRR